MHYFVPLYDFLTHGSEEVNFSNYSMDAIHTHNLDLKDFDCVINHPQFTPAGSKNCEISSTNYHKATKLC